MPLAFLISMQRSGTNFFRGILESHPDLVPYPEVFEEFPSQAPFPTRIFWDFYLERVKADPLAALPQPRPELVEDYFAQVEAAHPGQTAVLDVKHNSLHHANGIWHRSGGRPEIAEIIRRRGDAVILLIRRNILRMLVSLDRALAAKYYHAYSGDEVPRMKIQMDAEHLLATIRCWQNDQCYMQDVFSCHPRSLTLIYEDFWEDYPGGILKREPFEQVSAFLGIPPAFDLTPTMVKFTPNDLRETVANLDEVDAALRGTEVGWMLDS